MKINRTNIMGDLFIREHIEGRLNYFINYAITVILIAISGKMVNIGHHYGVQSYYMQFIYNSIVSTV